MKYKAKVKITIKNKVIDKNKITEDIPEESAKWLLEQGLIEKVKKNAKA
jgi:hypothetical protein